MGMPDEPYYTIIVETYRISGSGLHGDIHVRPVKGNNFRRRFTSAHPRKCAANIPSAPASESTRS
ncbi:MAG: hypothetical protein QOI87_2823 [Bradyrhizobium sp.]|jgi:hypothetical protein|nr:hypothetical protein [Bradyrhizobium sp.]